MSKQCAKCGKTVYALEELKCLDKIWHKGCFKCHECGMTLNMKTYKGFDKLPYCEAHIPKAKATTVAETPELKRIQENTKIQSNAVYHADFEKSKGKFTAVADDPELLRIKQNTKIISNVTYHGELEKKAMMEQKRSINDSSDVITNGSSDGRKSPSYLDELASVPAPQPPSQNHQYSSNSRGNASHVNQQQQYNNSSSNYAQYPSMGQQTQPSIHHNSHPIGGGGGAQHNYYSSQNSNSGYSAQRSNGISSVNNSSVNSSNLKMNNHNHQKSEYSNYHQAPQHQSNRTPNPPYYNPPQVNAHQNSSGGYSTGYNNNHANPSPYSARNQPNVIYSSDGHVNNSGSRKVGSIADYDPMNNYYGSLDPRIHHQQGHGTSRMNASGNMGYQQPPPPSIPPPVKQNMVCYRTMYDYEAQDHDEVSFYEGDVIIESTPIEEGWLTGTVKRTGERGMIPANYVQLV